MHKGSLWGSEMLWQIHDCPNQDTWTWKRYISNYAGMPGMDWESLRPTGTSIHTSFCTHNMLPPLYCVTIIQTHGWANRLHLKSFFIFWLHCAACRILVLQPGIEPVPPTVEVWNINHWTTREVPKMFFKMSFAHANWVLHKNQWNNWNPLII